MEREKRPLFLLVPHNAVEWKPPLPTRTPMTKVQIRRPVRPVRPVRSVNWRPNSAVFNPVVNLLIVLYAVEAAVSVFQENPHQTVQFD